MLKEKLEKVLEEGISEEEWNSPETQHGLQNLTYVFQEVFFKHLVSRGSERSNKPSPSGLGSCTRKLAYKYHSFEEEPLTAKTRMTLLFGDMVELIIVALCTIGGIPIRDYQKRINLDGIEGSLDFVYEDSVFDVKSMAPYGFEKSKKAGIDDVFGYLTQANIYATAEDKQPRILGINKATGDFDEFPIKRNPTLVEIAKKKKEIVEKSTPDNLPDRDYQLVEKKGKMYLDIPCRYCGFRNSCWDIIKEEEGYQGSIQYLAKGPK